MKRRVLRLFPSLISMVIFMPQTTLQAAPAVDIVTFSSTGLVLTPPAWQDATGQDLTTIVFNFGSRLAGSQPGVHVDSSVFRARLVNAAAYPATVLLSRPSGCGIGPNVVNDANVRLLLNGMAYDSNGAIFLASAADQQFALRFDAAGGHGVHSGTVSCARPGSLTYSY